MKIKNYREFIFSLVNKINDSLPKVLSQADVLLSIALALRYQIKQCNDEDTTDEESQVFFDYTKNLSKELDKFIFDGFQAEIEAKKIC